MSRHSNRALIVIPFLLLIGSPHARSAQDEPWFPPEVFANRRARLAAELRAPMIVPGEYLVRAGGVGKQDPNFWYLTGVQSPFAILVIVPGGMERREVLFLPERFQFAGAQFPIDDERFRTASWNRPLARLAPGNDAIRATAIAEVAPIDDFTTMLPDLLGDVPTVYVAGDTRELYAPPGLPRPLTYRQQFTRSLAASLRDVHIENLTPAIERMRLVKDSFEIAALRRAAAISATGMIEGMRATRPGLRDLAVAGVMEAVWKREGAPRTSFGPIVSSGPASLTLYTLRAEAYDFGDRIMQAGDLLFADYGAAEFQMYTSDLCRTWPVSGRFTTDQRRYYEMVLEAQDSALAHIRPGVMMLEVIHAAARVFQRYGLEPYEDIDRMGEDRVWGIMPSPTYWLRRGGSLTDYSGARGIGVRDLGHHIGLEALDSRDYTRPLAPGMVFTVEPKLYIPDENIAIMIEDMILVTDNGYENLSAAAPRRVEDIERIMTNGR